MKQHHIRGIHTIIAAASGTAAGALTAYPAGVWAVPASLLVLNLLMGKAVRRNAWYLLVWLQAYFMLSLGWLVWALQPSHGWGVGWSMALVFALLLAQAAAYVASYAVMAGLFAARARSRLLHGLSPAALWHPWAIGMAFLLAELGRAHWDVGTTWGSLAYSQVDNPALRAVFAWVGTPGVAALLMLFCALLAQIVHCLWARTDAPQPAAPTGARTLIPHAPIWSAGLLLLAWLGASMVNWTNSTRQTYPIRLVHTDMTEGAKFSDESQQAAAHLMLELAGHNDVVATLYPELFLVHAPYLYDKAWRSEVLQAIRATGNHQIVGMPDSLIDKKGSLLGSTNSLVQLTPTGFGHRLAKETLIPFTEQTGGSKLIEWMQGAFNAYPSSNFVPGARNTHPFIVGDLSIGAVICSELMNPFIYHARAANAHVMLNAASESWIDSPVLEGLIWQATKARALESRKPLLRAANVGYAGYVHPDASIFRFTSLHQKWHVSAYEGITPYTRWMRWWYARQ